MNDIKELGVKIKLDIERELVFSLNIQRKCIKKYGSMDNVLNDPAKDLDETIWIATEMANEGAAIWNYENPDNKISMITEEILCRYVVGLGGLENLAIKVREAMLKGLPEDKVEIVEAAEKNLIAAQSLNREQRRKMEKNK